MASYDISNAALPAMDLGKADFAPDDAAFDFPAIAQAVTQPAVMLDDGEVASIMLFLKALKNPVAAKGGPMGQPDSAPSGLPVDECPPRL